MTDSFGNSDDTGEENKEGTNFGQTPGDESSSATDNKGTASDDLEALRLRDQNAQALIPTLQSENSELRDKVIELERQLASATTIEEALDRISNNGGTDEATGLDAQAVTQIVDQVLVERTNTQLQDSNWQVLQQKLTDIYGDWKTADAKVTERARELDISLQDATQMAKNNPKVFGQLFLPATYTTNTNSSSGVRSGGSGQTVAGALNASASTLRDAAYYSKLRRENPAEYWKTETQLQYRRDLFS